MDEGDLLRNDANFTALTPLSFLTRAASVYPDRVAVIHGAVRFTYRQFYERCRRLADALRQRGIGPGDTVAVMAPNIPPLLEAHYGVPMAGGVLNALNYRLDTNSIASFLDHGEAKLLIVDREFVPVVAKACRDIPVVEIDDGVGNMSLVGATGYEALLAAGDPAAPWSGPPDEWAAIALNYTSGTSGNPRGVVYHHRGATLNAMSNAMLFGLNRGRPVYLWTLPMFHCNGWTFTWGVTAVAGTHVCLRRIDPAAIFGAIAEHRVTHLCGAPTVLNLLVNAPDKHSFDYIVEVATGGAAPPAAIIAGMEAMGFRVTHLYGLTESFGPSAICGWQDEWQDLSLPERAQRMSRQGVANLVPVENRIVTPEMTDVPADGATMGELVLRGNSLMRGYLKNPEATSEAFKNGWFHTGDLAVRHPDGYVEIRDRSKDIIIVGGDNVSSLEIEDVLYRHPEVLEAAVVAKPDPVFGEVPCAFVTLKPGRSADITAWCRDHLAIYKVPQEVVFGTLPKTATGKIQKFELRNRLRGTATQEKLTAIWRVLLDDNTIGVTDNFFDHGGTSFLALRLAQEMSLPVGVVFSHPTIQAQARFLDGKEEVKASLIPIRNGSGRPIFVVHWLLLTLIRHLESERPVYNLSFAVGAQQRMEYPARLEDLAAHYVSEMKSAQPTGPYTLLGYSAGGLVAFEMAQQLRASGDCVGYLGLIDTSVVKDMLWRGPRLPLHRQLRNIWDFSARELYVKLRAYVTGRAEHPWLGDGSTLEFWAAYEPQPYRGNVTLFVATGAVGIRNQRIPVERAWIELIDGRLDIHRVAGRHFGVIEEPYVRALATKLHHSIKTE